MKKPSAHLTNSQLEKIVKENMRIVYDKEAERKIDHQPYFSHKIKKIIYYTIIASSSIGAAYFIYEYFSN